MAANQNFSVKWTLAEANAVRRAVQRARDAGTAELLELTGGRADTDLTVADRELAESLRAEVGTLDTVLRRDL